jgi:hypothetical protein
VVSEWKEFSKVSHKNYILKILDDRGNGGNTQIWWEIEVLISKYSREVD